MADFKSKTACVAFFGSHGCDLDDNLHPGPHQCLDDDGSVCWEWDRGTGFGPDDAPAAAPNQVGGQE